MTTEDEQDRIARLLALAAPEVPAAAAPEMEEGLDPNDVAHLAAGQPGDAARAALEACLVAAPPEDRATVAAVANAAPRAERGRLRGARWMRLATAAAVLAVVGSIWALQRPATAELRGDEALLAAWESLRSELPEGLAGLGPLMEADRLDAEPPLRRGGLRIASPAGTLALGPPRVRWETLPGAESYLVRIVSDEGEELVRATEVSSPLRAAATAGLKPGAYVVSVATVVAGVQVRGSSAFRIASPVEVEQYRAALRAIDATEPAALRPVLRAHLAIRLGLIEEAREHVERAGEAGSVHGVLEQTRAYLRQRYGGE